MMLDGRIGSASAAALSVSHDIRSVCEFLDNDNILKSMIQREDKLSGMQPKQVYSSHETPRN